MRRWAMLRKKKGNKKIRPGHRGQRLASHIAGLLGRCLDLIFLLIVDNNGGVLSDLNQQFQQKSS